MSTPHTISNPTEYVLGFAFDLSHGGHRVCLIEKQKPDWQRGKLNGVGGKRELGEDPFEAMAREFAEETGVVTRPADWHCFHVMRFGNGAIVYCFTSHLPNDQIPRTMETEEVEMYLIASLRFGHSSYCIPNLAWLVPMAYHQLIESPKERMLMPIDRRTSAN